MTSNPPPITSPGWSSRTKRTIVLISLLVVAVLAWRLTEILPIIVIALVLSYLLFPIARFLDRRILSVGRKPRQTQSVLAILLTFMLMLAFVGIVVLIVFPVIFDQLQEFFARLPDLFGSIEAQVRDLLSRPIVIGEETIIPLESLEEALGVTATGSVPALSDINLADATSTFIRSLTGPAFSFLGGAVNAVINFVFLLTLMFYLLKDGALFVDRLVAAAPDNYHNDTRRLFYELGQVWNAYLRGQLILSLTMGAVVFLAATILGVPNAPILGLLSALLEFIPNIGPALALIPAALLAVGSQSSTLPFLEGVPFMLTVIVVWTLLQNIEAVLLVPRIMGDSLNLHPFVVMVGVLAGAAVGGALGVILAAPVIASIRVLGQYIYGKLSDTDPFPPPREPVGRQPTLLERAGRVLSRGRGGDVPASTRRRVKMRPPTEP